MPSLTLQGNGNSMVQSTGSRVDRTESHICLNNCDEAEESAMNANPMRRGESDPASQMRPAHVRRFDAFRR
jgi:hypothetical protein